MRPPPLLSASSSSFSSPLPLPFWLGSSTRQKSKVRLVGLLDALYLEHRRLVVQVGEEDLFWVCYDDSTSLGPGLPDALEVGQRLQVDGILSGGRVQATRVVRA